MIKGLFQRDKLAAALGMKGQRANREVINQLSAPVMEPQKLGYGTGDGDDKEFDPVILAQIEEELGPDHPNTLTTVSNLATELQAQGKFDQAEMMNRSALLGREKIRGKFHPETMTSVNNLASVLCDQEKYEEAEELNRRVLAWREINLVSNH